MVVRFGSVHTDWSSWVETTEVVFPDLTLDSGKFRMGCGGYVFRRAGILAMLVVRFDSDQPHGPAAPLGPMHGPGTGATVTAALERTPDAKHRRNVVPEPQPRRQAQGRATDGGCGGSRLIRPNSDYPFWAPIFEGHRNPMRVPPDFGFRPIQISTFSTTWLWTCE